VAGIWIFWKTREDPAYMFTPAAVVAVLSATTITATDIFPMGIEIPLNEMRQRMT
jgi:hypothetical protein